jgi:hypothetical protein
MKLPCNVIRDLLPLYAEDMVSPESRALTEEHIAECAACRAALEAMGAKTPDVQFRMDTAQEFAKYEKKKKRRLAALIAGVTAAGVALYFLIHIVLILGAVGFMLLGAARAKVEVDTDPSHYSLYMGKDAEKEYRNKWGMDESIFPAELTDDMEVLDYKMVYYDPWDAQYLSYLTVTYSPESYSAELSRLAECGITDYEGYYEVTGFADERDPIAMYADDYSGFVYAIHTPDKENTITYVELIFCNYSYDIEYEDYIPQEYLPLGFDAHPNNQYQQGMRM